MRKRLANRDNYLSSRVKFSCDVDFEGIKFIMGDEAGLHMYAQIIFM